MDWSHKILLFIYVTGWIFHAHKYGLKAGMWSFVIALVWPLIEWRRMDNQGEPILFWFVEKGDNK